MSIPSLARSRRGSELGLGLLAVVVTGGGYVVMSLADQPNLPADLWAFLGVVLGLFVLAHLAVRRLAPNADGTLLPLVAMLNGIGFIFIARLDREQGRTQALWTAVGVTAFILTLLIVRRARTLERYRYTALFLGIALLLLPLVPGVGREINGSRLWVHLGPFQVQPGEGVKILMVLFFASYLVDKRELLTEGSVTIGRLRIPDPKHLGPLLLAWGVSIAIMVLQKDLGSSLLFFSVFAAMLYIATSRVSYLLLGLVMFVGGAVIAYMLFAHVQSRVGTWLDPWPVADRGGYQLVQGLFAFGNGGIAGTGLGLSNPRNIPLNTTDSIFAVIGEELGIVGTIGVISTFMLLVGSGFRVALQAERSFPKLFAAGLTTILGIQAFVIVGGVSRFIPLTGVTLPFISFGGSSLVANYVIIALLLRISDEETTRELDPDAARSRRPVASAT